MKAIEHERDSNNPSLIFRIGAWMTVAGIFSIPLLGNAAHNLLLGLPVILLLFTKEIRQFPSLLRQNKTALTAVALFCLMLVSIMWSQAETKYSFKILAKYREFLFIPLFIIYLAFDKFRRHAFIALYSALFLSLIFSYLIHYDVTDYGGNENSIKNRIFHGISMSFFAYMTLQAAFTLKQYRFIFIGTFLVTLHNLFFIENGRTGYLLIVALTTLFIWQTWRLKGLMLCVSVLVLGMIFTFIFAGDSIRIFDRMDVLNSASEINLTILQQMDIRIEYYVVSFLAFTENLFIGTGLGAFPEAYKIQHASMTTFWDLTVNAHNEFLQISVQTGLIGLVCFCAFLASPLIQSKQYSHQQKEFCSALFITFLISCMFNSSFLDHGDGVFFMVLTAMIAGRPWLPATSMSESVNE